jgi:hypothetical protein
MPIIAEMLASNPARTALDPGAVTEAIEACLEASAASTICADACLAEDGVAELRTCIRRDLDAADLLSASSAVLGRQVSVDLGLTRVVLETATVAAKTCAEECEKHAEMHVHCAVCAAACRRAEAACRALLEALRDRTRQPDVHRI